jgi:HSP20 family molecular chaperone IbpA
MIKENLTNVNVGDAPADMYLDVEGLITIEVDLPGTSLSAVNLQLVDHNLELSFTKTPSPENVQYIHRERNRTCKPRIIRDLPIGITVSIYQYPCVNVC